MHKIRPMLVLTILLSLSFVALASATEVTIQAKPDQQKITAGQQFIVDLYVTPGQDIDAVAINLSAWDPNLAEVVSITPGNLFTQNTIWVPGQTIDNQKGTIQNIIWGSSESTSSPGIFAKITFKAKQNGNFIFNIPPQGFDAASIGQRLPTKILSTSTSIEKTGISANGNNISNEEAILIIGLIIVMVAMMVTFILKRKKEMKIKPKEEEASTDNIEPQPIMAKTVLIKVKRNGRS